MWRKGTKFGKKLGNRVRSSLSERKNLLLDVALILLVAVASIVGFTLVTAPSSQRTSQSYTPQITVGLTVWANYPNGTKIPGSARFMPNDLILDAFNKLLEDVLVTGDSFSLLTVTSPTPYTFITYSGGAALCTSSNSISCGVEFEIGTGGTSVARTDTGMTTGYTPSGGMLAFPDTAENPSPTTTPNTAACNTGGTTDYVYGISGSQVITSSVTINEIGLFARNAFNVGSASSMMWLHDGVSPGISVISGDTVTVNYQINLNNPGFTNNFCYLIASMFTGNIATDGADAFSLKATDGTTNTFYNWCGYSNVYGNQVLTPFSTSNVCSTHTGQGEMEIGKGTTPFTPATFALSSILGSATAISVRAYSSLQNFYTTTFTISGSNSITEACEGIVLSSKFYCMFGLTFTGQPQTSGVPFGFTLRMGD